MPSTLPDGEPVPTDGSLPPDALSSAAERTFGVYLHVPFCSVRCGYCDFNTYTATELGGGVGVEVAVAAAHLAERHVHVDAEGTPTDPGQRSGGQRPVLGRRVCGG